MAYFTTRALRAALVNITVLIIVDPHSVGIGLKEMGGQMSKCLKFCPGIEI